jgi:hypothetical protein
MEENLITPQPDQPIQSNQTIPAVRSGQPAVPETTPNASFSKIKGKTRDFLIGFLLSLLGAIVLALLDLLFIATVNPALGAIVSFLVYLGPLLIFGLYIFFLVYFLKKRRFIFWGLFISFFIFIGLMTVALKIL